MQPSLAANKNTKRHSNPLPVTTRHVLFPFHSPTENAQNTAISRLATFPNQTMKLQHDQSGSVNIPPVGSKYQSSAISSNDQAVAFRSYEKSNDTSSRTSPQSFSKNKNRQLPSPLRAAPMLLSPNQNLKTMQHDNVVKTGWTANDRRRLTYGTSVQLKKPGCDKERLTVKKQNQSKIEDLKKAYFTSISPSSNVISKNTKMKSNMKAPSLVVQNNSPSYISGTNDNVADLVRKTQIEHSVVKAECRRDVALLQCNDDVKKSIEAQSKSEKNTSCDSHPSDKIETAAGFDWNHVVASPSKPASDLPNFLAGFDKVSKDKLNRIINQSSETEAACHSQQCAEFSPAYHTSKSFDDFHRYLGKGLSPTLPPAPKFPNLRNAGPVVPSPESIDQAPLSSLTMRPRNKNNTIPTAINRAVTSTNACATISEISAEIGLSEAYEGTIMSSCREQAPQPQHAQGKNDDSGLNQYGIFGEKPVSTLDQDATNGFQKIVTKSDQNQLQKQDSVSDFPLEGMTFEDFDTLASCPDTSTEQCSNCCCVTTGLQSDTSEGPNAGFGGRLLSDDSDGMQMDEYFQGNKRKSSPSLVQSATVRAKIRFLP